MLKAPHYRFTGDITDAERLASLEVLVPGALVYGYEGRTRRRLKDHLHLRGTFEVIVVVHGAFLVDGHLSAWNLDYSAKAVNGAEEVFPYPEDDSDLRAEGRELLASIADVVDLSAPFPWQEASPAWAASRPWVMKIWPTGTGKTAGAIVDIMVNLRKFDGDAIICVPGGARSTWMVQLPKYLRLPAHVVKPESQRRKKDQSLDGYVAECREVGRPAIVVVGMEDLASQLPTLATLRPTVLVIDELHKLGSHERWTATHNTDGTVSFTPKTTAGGEKVKQAVAAMQLSALPTLRFRMGMTATPLGDGKPRRAWSPLDILSRGGFGYSYWNTWVKRYCGGKPAQWGGGIDDSGSTFSGELQDRLAFIRHQVPYSATRKGMQPFKVDVVRLPVEEQSAPGKFDDALTFHAAIRKAAAEDAADSNEVTRTRSIEYRLMDACARKRGWVIDTAVDALRCGSKVVVFTGRRSEVDEWARQIEKKAGQTDDGVKVRVLRYSGDYNDKDKIEIARAFRDDPGPLLLVATGQSIGESFDGLQWADVGILAMLPWQGDQFVQWRGRFDRAGGVPTTLYVVVALSTYDERVVTILDEKFGNIADLFAAEEIEGVGDRLTGSDNRSASLSAMLSLLAESTASDGQDD